MFNIKNKIIVQYSFASLILGIFIGCFIAINFYEELQIKNSTDVYYYSQKFDDQIDKLSTKIERLQKIRNNR